jgi:16S rRNA (cytosine967-C5)-methyltransferase
LAKNPKQTDARRLAWEVLRAVEEGAFADAVLGQRLDTATLDARDRALATRLVYGTLAWQGYLDHVIETLARPPRKLDAPIRTLLRLALFQIAKLSRVPDFAAVDTAVELSKDFRAGAASRMVNAVLRRYLRERSQLPTPSRDDDLPGFLSLFLSHPRWLVERWLAELGPADAEALLMANNEPAPTVLRVNRLRADPDEVLRRLAEAGVVGRPTGVAPDAVLLEHPGDLATLPGFVDGFFTPQGEASQLICFMLGVEPGDRVLDACAAPGGKTTYIAELMRDEGAITAVDKDSRGLEYLEQSSKRLGLGCIETVHANASEFTAAGGKLYDAVLLDAPCSGLGTLREHPEIRWRRTPESIREISKIQQSLLEAVSTLAKPCCPIVYASCTLTREENETVIERFLASHDNFVLSDPRPFLPPRAWALVDEAGFFRSFPHRDGMDGFFAARLRCRR